MLQNIIVITIILAAIAYTIYAVVKSLLKKNASNCDDCSGCDVKHEIMKNLKNKPPSEPFHCSDFKKPGDS